MPRGKYPRQSAAVKAAIAKVAPITAPPPAAKVAEVAPAPTPAVIETVAPVVLESAAPVETLAAPPVPPAIDPALVADAAAVVEQAAKVAEVAISYARRPHRFADHAKSRNIDSLTFDELRAYGLEIGMSKRDCRDLTEGRLRAGCRAHLAHHFDELTE